MPTLDQHHSDTFVKILAIGNSKTRKTTSMISLVKAGYLLRILDMDNLLDPLRYFIMRDCPELAKNVEYRTLRDERSWGPHPLTGEQGPIVKSPRAYAHAVRMMDRWKYDETDLGKPAEWGPKSIFVIDSLSRLCDAAYDFREPLVPVSRDGKYDLRAAYGDAQDAIENNIANLTSEGFRTNVLVFAHVTFQELPDGTIKGFPQGVGQKLSPKIPQYFSSVVLYTDKGIQMNSTPLIDLANPKPFAMQPRYPVETGLADIFNILLEKGEHDENTPQVNVPVPSTKSGDTRANTTPSHGSPSLQRGPRVGVARRS